MKRSTPSSRPGRLLTLLGVLGLGACGGSTTAPAASQAPSADAGAAGARSLAAGAAEEEEETMEEDAAEFRLTDEEWRERLTPEQYRVTRQAGTERAYSGEYWDVWIEGVYHCVGCDLPLFASDTKFDAGCGWPSYFETVTPGAVTYHEDRSHGMVRTEIRCSRCEAHLGHVFDDGPPPTGKRYCLNSVAMKLRPAEQ